MGATPAVADLIKPEAGLDHISTLKDSILRPSSRASCRSAPLEENTDLLASLSTLLYTRHSTRHYLPTPVPPHLIHEALQLAQEAPSNSNIQNWRLHLLSGPALNRMNIRMAEAASKGAPSIPPLPSDFARFRSELGEKLYGGAYGIQRGDTAARLAQVRRNFQFFGAPLAGIVCMDKRLGPYDALSVGMWLQSLLLALTAQGLGTCVLVSTKGYEQTVKEAAGIEEGMEVICGLAIGYEDTKEKANKLDTGRVRWEDCVVEMFE